VEFAAVDNGNLQVVMIFIEESTMTTITQEFIIIKTLGKITSLYVIW